MKNEKLAGMGSIPHDKGVAFRVWAPNAAKVYVKGSFNDWKEDEDELQSEENGYWYGDIEKAKIGDQYKYVIWNGEQKLLKNDPYAKELTNSAGNTIIVDPHFEWDDVEFNMPVWNELVFYELHVGTFNSPQRDMPGNLKSVTKKIPYLKNLGINAIQLMPIMEFPGDYSWGYNTGYPFSVESSYGTTSDLKRLVNEAHKAGIAVILDVIYNHFGPSDLDLWQFDGWHQDGKGGIYFYNDWRSETPWGDTRPDYGRDEVKQYLRDNALMWLQDFRFDGLRLDATAFIRNSKGNIGGPEDDIPEGWMFMQWINEEIDNLFPYKISIAEDLCLNPWLTKTTGEGGAGFGTQWDNSFAADIRKSIITNEDNQRNMDVVKEQVAKQIDGDVFSRIIYTESHDSIANGQSRIPEEIWPGNADHWFSRKRSVLGAALVFTSAGIPMIFQGQEFLEDRMFYDKDPLDWNLAEQYSGLIQLYKTLIELRRNVHGTTKGLSGQHTEVYHVNNNEKVIAYHRWYNGGAKDSVVVIANFRNESFENYVVGVPMPGVWKVRFNSDWKGYDDEFTDNYTGEPNAGNGNTDGMEHYITLSIGPYSVLILSQD
jgi:1,4-alpha-glucan branching enzyme